MGDQFTILVKKSKATLSEAVNYLSHTLES